MNKPLKVAEEKAFAVFSESTYRGNQALVIFSHAFEKSPSLEQQFELTRNFGVSASCLLWQDKQNQLHARWANSKQEIQYCGHGALAAAAFLDSKGMLQKEQSIQFAAGKYWLGKEKDRYWLSPKTYREISPESYGQSKDLLGTEPIESAACMGSRGYLILRIDDDTDLTVIEPNLAVLESTTARALILTSRLTQHPEFDYALRYFAPQYGVIEDSATGSANEIAAHFWFPRINKQNQMLSCYQASSAGGVIYARKDENKDIWVGGKVIAL